MPGVDPIDFKRASAVGRRIIEVDVPADLVAKKGASHLARRRCREAEDGLRKRIAKEFAASRRRPYRGEVAIHLELAGIDDLAAPRAHRTVKAIVDAMKGPVFADDRAAVLLDVRSKPGELAARISTSSAGEYIDRFDVLGGVGEDEEDDDVGWSLHRPKPWTWDRELLDGDELDQAREALNDLRSFSLADADFSEIERFYAERVAELEKLTFTLTPYQATDRPGEPNLAARIWASNGIRGGANQFDIPAPSGGEGSWTSIASEAWRCYATAWYQASKFLQRESFALDIAVGASADRGFDIDNLAARVLTAMRKAVPHAAPPDSYRVYRRTTPPGTVVVTLHHPQRAQALRQAMTQSFLALGGHRIDPEARAHRRRSGDAKALEKVIRRVLIGREAEAQPSDAIESFRV